jgi:hypothetical protein
MTGAGGHLQHDRLAAGAGALLAHAGAAVLGLEMLPETEVDQRVEALDGDDDDIAPAAAVATVRAAEFDEFLTPEAGAAGAAVSALDVDPGFVEELHPLRPTKKGNAAHSPNQNHRAARNGSARRLHRHEGARAGLAELHPALGLGEDRVILADADIVAGMYLGAALANDDVAGHDSLAAVFLDPEPAAFGIAAVA